MGLIVWEGLSAFELPCCNSFLFALARSPPVFNFSIFGSFDPFCRCLQGILVGPTLGPLLQPLTGVLLQ